MSTGVYTATGKEGASFDPLKVLRDAKQGGANVAELTRESRGRGTVTRVFILDALLSKLETTADLEQVAAIDNQTLEVTAGPVGNGPQWWAMPFGASIEDIQARIRRKSEGFVFRVIGHDL